MRRLPRSRTPRPLSRLRKPHRTNGAAVTADYVIAGFDLKTITVRNATQTNVLKFNTPTELEVPLK